MAGYARLVEGADEAVGSGPRNSSDGTYQPAPSTSRCQKIRGRSLWLVHGALLVISFTFFLAALHQTRRAQSCVEKHSTYSPAMGVLDDEDELWRFNATFGQLSRYTQPPRPEVDAAWREITEVGAISITEHELDILGAPRTSVRLPPESGGGYMAAIEQLLWQHTYKDYYAGSGHAFAESDDVLRVHLNHCTDLLRQKLMCDSDVGVLTYYWDRKISSPRANFNTQHKCRSFERVLQWSVEHAAPDPVGGRVTKTAGIVEYPTPPVYGMS